MDRDATRPGADPSRVHRVPLMATEYSRQLQATWWRAVPRESNDGL